MKLPSPIIARRKLTHYLLTLRSEDDKSAFLALAGYTRSDVDRLFNDLSELSRADAIFLETTEYGDKYSIRGKLVGPNGRALHVVTICDERRSDQSNEIYYALSRQSSMKFEPFSRVALNIDLPDRGLRAGDIATIVETHVGRPDQEHGYTLEVFNAIGHTVAVITVRESEIEPLSANEILHVRPIATAA